MSNPYNYFFKVHANALCNGNVHHKNKSYPFAPPHIATIDQFDYMLTTFDHFKFASRLLH
jgi:hypothetical protein